MKIINVEDTVKTSKAAHKLLAMTMSGHDVQ